jgi:hypothetical protein
VGSLTTDRQTSTMSNALVRTDFHLATDVLCDISAKVALHLQVLIDIDTKTIHFVLGQIPDPGVAVDSSRIENLLTGRATDAIDIGKRNLYALFTRDIDARKTCHVSALPLFVSWIGANNHDAAVAANDLALFTDGFDAGTDFHLAPRNCVFTIARLLVSVGDPTSGEVVRSEFNLDFVARQDPDVMHAHLSGDVGQHLVAVFEFDAKHCVGEWFDDHTLQQNRIFLRLRQGILLGSVLAARTAAHGYERLRTWNNRTN